MVDKSLNKEIYGFSRMGVSFKVLDYCELSLYVKHRNHDNSSGNGNGSSHPLPVSRTCPFPRNKSRRYMKPHTAVRKVACKKETRRYLKAAIGGLIVTKSREFPSDSKFTSRWFFCSHLNFELVWGAFCSVCHSSVSFIRSEY